MMKIFLNFHHKKRTKLSMMKIFKIFIIKTNETKYDENF